MAQIPTDEQIREELHSTINSDPKLKCCANCCHYSLVAQYCSKIEKSFPRYFYGCRHYITNEEMLIAKARENLIEQARECGEVATFILEMARVGHHNRDNMDKVYRYMRQLANENANDKVVTFCLDDKDIGHYRLKE